MGYFEFGFRHGQNYLTCTHFPKLMACKDEMLYCGKTRIYIVLKHEVFKSEMLYGERLDVQCPSSMRLIREIFFKGEIILCTIFS